MFPCVRFMKQVDSEGKFMASPSPSPKDSPNHLIATPKMSGAGSSPLGGEDKGGGRKEPDYAALLQRIQEMGMEKSFQGAYMWACCCC